MPERPALDRAESRSLDSVSTKASAHRCGVEQDPSHGFVLVCSCGLRRTYHFRLAAERDAKAHRRHPERTDECLCSNSPRDYFGEQHHIVNPACPLCADGDPDPKETPDAS